PPNKTHTPISITTARSHLPILPNIPPSTFSFPLSAPEAIPDGTAPTPVPVAAAATTGPKVPSPSPDKPSAKGNSSRIYRLSLRQNPKADPNFRLNVREVVENGAIVYVYGVDLEDLCDGGGDGGQVEEHAGAEVDGGTEEGDSEEEFWAEGGGDGEGDGGYG
ncbi:MAG: hypothetical protein L6R41_007315, partial [Letrouitia leprolyta]